MPIQVMEMIFGSNSEALITRENMQDFSPREMPHSGNSRLML